MQHGMHNMCNALRMGPAPVPLPVPVPVPVSGTGTDTGTGTGPGTGPGTGTGTGQGAPHAHDTSFFLLEAVLSSLPTGQTRPTSTFWTRRRDDIRTPSMVRLLTCAPFAQRSPEREKSTRRQIDDFSGLRIGERSEPRKK